ncbi:MAG: hypothetical protein ACXWW0_12510, partial [Bacteroidia bacterium]
KILSICPTPTLPVGEGAGASTVNLYLIRAIFIPLNPPSKGGLGARTHILYFIISIYFSNLILAISVARKALPFGVGLGGA